MSTAARPDNPITALSYSGAALGKAALEESRNIVHYWEPYRSYREIGELSLEEAFENLSVVGGTADLIERYFELFPEMQLYPDVLPTLERGGKPLGLTVCWINPRPGGPP